MDIYNIPKDYIEGLIQKINLCEEKIVKTRNQKLRSTSSCRVWQLNYCIISYFYKIYNNQIFNNLNVINKICECIKIFLLSSDTESSVLHQIIFYNRPINLTQINSFDDILMLRDYSSTQAYFMCIYNENIDLGSILHFFTIIRKNDIYFINSSYGSDYVCVPQYTTILNVQEFNKFCYDLTNKTSEIPNFFEKYFLKGNLKKRYNSDTIEYNQSLKSSWISPSSGKKKEIEILYSKYSYKIGLINNYNELVSSFITNINANESINFSLFGGRRKKQKKLKSRKLTKHFK